MKPDNRHFYAAGANKQLDQRPERLESTLALARSMFTVRTAALHFLANSGLEALNTQEANPACEVEATLVAQALQSVKPLVIGNVATEAGSQCSDISNGTVSDIGFFVSVPLKNDANQLIGIIYLAHDQPKNFTEEHLTQLIHLARIVEDQVEKRQLLNRLDDVNRSQHRLASVIAGTNVGTWEWNVQTGETFFNERWADIAGYTLSELQPVSIETWLALAHPADLKASERALNAHISGEASFYDIVCRMKHADGHWVWVRDRGQVVSWTDDGKPLWIAGTHSDVTEQVIAEQALAESEQKYRSLVNNIPGITYRCLLDHNWTIIYMSDGVDPLSGYPASDFINNAVRSYLSVIHPDDQAWTERAVTDAVENGEPWHLEYRIMHKDGSVRWAQERGSAIWENDQLLYLDGFILDVSNEASLNREVKRQLEAFKTLNDIAATPSVDEQELVRQALTLGAGFLGLDIGILSSIKDHTYTVENFVAPEKAGLSVGQTYELAKTHCALTISQHDLISIDKMGASPYAGHPCYQAFGMESYIGMPVHLGDQPYGTVNFSSPHARASEFSDVDRLFLRLLARWISSALEREDSVRELKHSEARLRGLFELSPIGIGLNSFETGAFIDANPALVAPSGYSKEDFLALSYWDLTPSEYESIELEQLESLKENARYGPFEKEYIRKDGSRYPVLLNGILLEGSDGNKLIWSIIEDISERKRMERLQNEFISTVSHELRTPLTAIRGALGILKSDIVGPMPKKASELIFVADKNVTRLNLLINDLLDMEKLIVGKMQFNVAECSVTELLEEAIAENKYFAEPFSVSLELARNSVDCEILADRDRFLQIMANLISNAAKYSPKNGVVQIAHKCGTSSVCVSVSDEGPGIPAEFHDRLFSKFAQADASDARAKSGTGLGLAITKALVEQMGGHIELDLTVIRGATFHFYLPLASPSYNTN